MSIELSDVRIFARHGVFSQENTVGNEFKVDLRVDLRLTDAMSADSLEGTVSYADLYDIVSKQMSQPSNLLENVALRIASEIRKQCPQIEAGEVRIEKTAPPIGNFCGKAAVTLRF